MNQALLSLGITLIKENSNDCLIVIRSDSDFEMVASSRTWAIGAALRAECILGQIDQVEED